MTILDELLALRILFDDDEYAAIIVGLSYDCYNYEKLRPGQLEVLRDRLRKAAAAKRFPSMEELDMIAAHNLADMFTNLQNFITKLHADEEQVALRITKLVNLSPKIDGYKLCWQYLHNTWQLGWYDGQTMINTKAIIRKLPKQDRLDTDKWAMYCLGRHVSGLPSSYQGKRKAESVLLDSLTGEVL